VSVLSLAHGKQQLLVCVFGVSPPKDRTHTLSDVLMPAQFCKEVLSLGDEQILYTNGEFFVDSPGSCPTNLASSIAQSIDALDRKQAQQFKENSGGSNGSPKQDQTSALDVWKLIPFKRTNELGLLETKLKSTLKGRFKVLSESLERTAIGDVLHRHVSSLGSCPRDDVDAGVPARQLSLPG
jgi:hypothetical protein